MRGPLRAVVVVPSALDKGPAQVRRLAWPKVQVWSPVRRMLWPVPGWLERLPVQVWRCRLVSQAPAVRGVRPALVSVWVLVWAWV